MARTGRPPVAARERFFTKTRITKGGCIEWTGRLDRDGYGSFLPAGGRAVRQVRAHRWAYEHFVGPIPAGLQLDHLCRNRACVNPAHLEPVSPRENIMRGIGPAATNAIKSHCKRGHALSGTNVYVSGSHRSCKTCKRMTGAAYYRKSRAA